MTTPTDGEQGDILVETLNDLNVREQVRARYAELAERATAGAVDDCGCEQPADCGCGAGCCGPAAEQPGIGAGLYDDADRAGLPDAAVLASLGCGNPTAVAELRPARRSWTSAPAAASTCCCRPGGSARPARPTGWT